MTMHINPAGAAADRALVGLTTDMPKPGRPAFELECHIFGILARSMHRAKSNSTGIIVAEDDAGRTFKVEVSQVAGPA